MELDSVPRPRPDPPAYAVPEPRTKCSFCCGLRCAALVGAVSLLFTVPCNALARRGAPAARGGWWAWADRHLLLALPLAGITFTHHVLLSEALWGTQRKTVWVINWQSAWTNGVLWVTGTALGTYVSRRCLPRWSRRYRLALWTYHHRRRGCAHRWLPTLFGSLREDLDAYNVLWTLAVYHALWGTVTVFLEHEMGAHYAMLYRDFSYSRVCSPRWREWREDQVARHVHRDHLVAPGRWGTFLTNEKWRARGW